MKFVNFMKKYKGFFSLLLAGFIFGTFGIWIRILNRELSPFQQILFRSFIGFCFASFFVFLLKQKWRLNRVNKKILFFYAVGFPVAIICFVLSALNTKIAVTTFSFYASGIIGSFLIGVFSFKEKITRIKIVSFVLVIIGILFLSYPLSLYSLSFGLVIGLIGGFIDSVNNALRKFLSGKIDRFVLVAIQMLGGIIVASFLILINRQAIFIPIPTVTITTGIVFGFLLMSVSFLTLVGFQKYDLNLGMIVLSSELVFAPIFAVVAFQEFPSIMEIIGGIFIAGAIVVSNLSLGKSRNRTV